MNMLSRVGKGPAPSMKPRPPSSKNNNLVKVEQPDVMSASQTSFRSATAVQMNSDQEAKLKKTAAKPFSLTKKNKDILDHHTASQ